MSWFRELPEFGAVVTPSDTGHLEQPATLFVGGAGNVKVLPAGSDAAAVTFTGVAAGSILPIVVVRVYNTDTTATNIVAMW